MRDLLLAPLLTIALLPCGTQATTYSVGPAQPLATLAEVPWESLAPGDVVEIHWRAKPYAEKVVLCRRGTVDQPIVVRGLRGPGGERPVITGENATTPPTLNFWNEPRGLIKIGGANRPADLLPAYLVIEGLHLRSAQPDYTFTDDSGATVAYSSNAAAIYVEKAEHLILRDNELEDAGNGLFIGVNGGQTRDILVEGNFIHNNGIVGRIYEHNSYTSALGITFQFNHYGALRPGAGGNNLKDRSAGLVVRYNWIESGNRQLDLVDGEDDPSVVNDPRYGETFVYGNVLIEPDGAGNSQIVHYGGDSGIQSDYRKGTLYFHHNTVVSTRAGNTTLLALSTNAESASVYNNIVYTAAGGRYLALLSSNGQLSLSHNWMSTGFVDSHSGGFAGSITDDGTGLSGGGDPGFVDLAAQDFHLIGGASPIDAAGPLPPAVLPDHRPVKHYVRHQRSEARPDDGRPDLGAFEFCAGLCTAPPTDGGPGVPDAGAADGGPLRADGGPLGSDGGESDGRIGLDGGDPRSTARGCACDGSPGKRRGHSAALATVLLPLLFLRQRRLRRAP